MPARDIADLMYLINHCHNDNKTGIAGTGIEPQRKQKKN